MALELDIPVIVLSQLGRGVESRRDKRPTLSDLQNVGTVEQDADVICFIYRDEVYNPHTDDKGYAEVWVAKHPHGRAAGPVVLRFFTDFAMFTDLDGFEDALRLTHPPRQMSLSKLQRKFGVGYARARELAEILRSADNRVRIEDRPRDARYEEALRLVYESRCASISWLQRQLGIGYYRAAKIIEVMELEGHVSSPSDNSDRQVLMVELLGSNTDDRGEL